MGVLLHESTGKGHTLPARVVVGRSAACGLVLAGLKVSREHSVLSWDGEAWCLRDLASRNGTFLNEDRLEQGDTRTLGEGDRVAFGELTDSWQLVDAGPPAATAFRVDGAGRRSAAGGLLLLPSPDDPVVAVFRGPTGWIAEQENKQFPVQDQQTLEVAGIPWMLSLPLDTEGTLVDAPAPRTVGMARFRFKISRDQEFVQVEANFGTGWDTLKPRSHHYLLYLLAKARVEDTADSEGERGWVHVEDVGSMVGMEPANVNVYVARARQQVGELGVEGAAGLVERRPGTGMMRFGVAKVEVGQL